MLTWPTFFLKHVRYIVNQEARMQPTLPAAPQEHGPLHNHPAANDEVRKPFLYTTV